MRSGHEAHALIETDLDVHVKRLRERFTHSKSFHIETVRGGGYKAMELKPSADRL